MYMVVSYNLDPTTGYRKVPQCLYKFKPLLTAQSSQDNLNQHGPTRHLLLSFGNRTLLVAKTQEDIARNIFYHFECMNVS